MRTVLATTLILLASAGPAAADVFVVDRTDDDANANACTTQNRDCTLRGAVADANAKDDADTITLPAGRIALATDLPFLSGPTTIVGAGARASIIDGAGHVAQVIVGIEDATLQDLTITGGALPGSGAVVGNSLTLERVALVDNQSVALFSLGNVSVADSVIARNASPGGAIEKFNGFLLLRNSTVADNVATGTTLTPGGVSFALGGGLVVAGANVIVANSTIAGNRAADGVPLLLGANLGEFQAVNMAPSRVVVSSSVIADGQGGNCAGTIESHGNNVETDGTCAFHAPGDRSPVAAMLGPLADNGGPTDTMALLAGSPAIDAGGDCPAADQRGQLRMLGTTCDSGAFESSFTAPPPSSAPPTPPAPPASAITTTVTTAPPVTVTAPAPPPPPVDRTAPRLTVSLPAKPVTRKTLRAGLKVRVAANEPIDAQVSLLVVPRRVTIARAPTLTLATALLRRGTGTRTVTLRPVPALTGHRTVGAQVRVVAYDAAGNRATKTIALTIR